MMTAPYQLQTREKTDRLFDDTLCNQKSSHIVKHNLVAELAIRTCFKAKEGNSVNEYPFDLQMLQ